MTINNIDNVQQAIDDISGKIETEVLLQLDYLIK